MIKAYWWSDDPHNEQEIITSAINVYKMKMRQKKSKTKQNNKEKRLRIITINQARELDEQNEKIRIMVKEIEDLTEKNKGTEEISDIGGKEEIRNDLNANTSEAVSNHDIMCTNASKSNLNVKVIKYTTSGSTSELEPNDVLIPDPVTDMADDLIFPTYN